MNREQRILTSNFLIGFLVSILLIVASTSFAAVPYIFKTGEVVSASKMNANFTALDAKKFSISTAQRGQYSDGNTSTSYTSVVASRTCNVGEIITGGTCACTSTNFNSSITNYGVLSLCQIAGNGIAGGCYADYGTWYSTKNGPAITVVAICASSPVSASTALEPVSNNAQELSTEAQELVERIQLQLNEIEQMHKK